MGELVIQGVQPMLGREYLQKRSQSNSECIRKPKLVRLKGFQCDEAQHAVSA
jgi:hypothetical protein